MPRRIPLRIAAAAIVVGLVASPAAQDAIRIEHRGQFELTGAGTPENVSVAASGPEWRSLLVTLEISSASGRVLYRDEWQSVAYFNTPPGWTGPVAGERTVRAELAALVGDQDARRADMISRGHRIFSEDEMRCAIEWDLLSDAHPRRREETAGEYNRRVGSARASLSPDRVAALLAELRDKPKFLYYTGSESDHGISWSDTESRFVRVYMRC